MPNATLFQLSATVGNGLSSVSRSWGGTRARASSPMRARFRTGCIQRPAVFQLEVATTMLKPGFGLHKSAQTRR